MANGIPFNMTLPKRNYKAKRAVRAMQELSDVSAINGVCNLTLDDINAEIIASRRSREALAAKREKLSLTHSKEKLFRL